MQQAQEQGARAIIITEKDAVKIPRSIIESERPLPIYVISIEVTFQKGDREFKELLQASTAAKIPKEVI